MEPETIVNDTLLIIPAALRTDQFREYPTNVFYNCRPPSNSKWLIDVPREQVAAELAGKSILSYLFTLTLSSIERCMIQLIYLFCLK